MKVQPAVMRCNKCKHDFDSEIIVQCAIEVFTAVIKSIQCPQCKASKYLALVTTKEAE